MLRLLAILAVGVTAALGPSAFAAPVVGAEDSSVGDSLESFVDEAMPDTAVPGLAYAVVADGEVVTLGASGVVREGGDEAVDADTPFLTGSVTKSFTALAVMQLVEQGRVNLDEALSDYLDDFAGQSAGVVSVRQLLSHTSGYSTLQGNQSHTDDDGGGEDELARRVDALVDVAPAYGPAERWEYSNTNYVILGRLVEVVSGETYQDYVAEHILDPLGMDDSFVADGTVPEEMATGHRPWFGGKRPYDGFAPSRGTAPAGGLVASAADLARYLQVMMNGEDDVLSAAGKAQMMRPASGTSTGYGLGWFVDSAEGSVWHGGTSPGFESQVAMIPGRDRGVVVLVNGGSGVGFGETAPLLNGITARALDVEDGTRSPLPQQLLFLALVLLPILYLLCIVWAWRHRAAIRAKSGPFGLFSLWFPLLTTLAGAWVTLSLVPRMIGAPVGTIRLYTPDLGLALIATAVGGVVWALFRLGVAYTR